MPSKSKKSKKFTTVRIMWVFLLLLSLGIAITALVTKGGYVSAYKLATSRSPENYTALYFTHPAKLPTYSPTGKVETIAFTIANHESKTETYYYRVDTYIGKSVTSTTEKVTVADGKSASLTTKLMIPTPVTPALVDIQILGRDNHLTFRSTS